MTDYALRELEEAYEMDPSDSDVEDLPLCSKYVELTEDSDEAAQRRQSNRLNLDALSPKECMESFRFDHGDLEHLRTLLHIHDEYRLPFRTVWTEMEAYTFFCDVWPVQIDVWTWTDCLAEREPKLVKFSTPCLVLFTMSGVIC